jgi:hypothetical protein
VLAIEIGRGRQIPVELLAGGTSLPRCPDCGGAIGGEAHVCRGTPPLSELPREAPEVGQVLADRFCLEERIGTGGSGVVFRAKDLATDAHVALKVVTRGLESEVADRVRREARITHAIDHPNVARVFDLGRAPDWPFYTMELVSGVSLSERVRRSGAVRGADLDRLARGLVAALAATHAKGFVHLDVKPSNVLVRPEGDPVLVDFGLAVERGTPQHGLVVGTTGFLAPERLEGATADPSADLWALARTLAFAVQGSLPEVADTTAALRAAGDPLARWLGRCLADDPAARPRDGTALAAALGA